MPAKNSRKIYVKNGYYHAYNRGVEKRNIFEDTQDYKVFLRYLKESLVPPNELKINPKEFTLKGQAFKGVPRKPKNFHGKIELIAYCLMPNHFHLLLKQVDDISLQNFMQAIVTRFSIYFNKRYDRVGSLFQGRYKAVLILEDNYLLHLSRYIHLNPSEYTDNLVDAYSSYGEYLGLRKTKWVKPDFILNFFNKEVAPEFKKVISYKDFVENYKKDSSEILGYLTLED
ncbi:hypothetical protein A2715_04795 [Candidatus Woesebacteria bacterium RIFCSPHIGHO2_01_FULL_39_32]|uniref:Transposase IS200-like domain-containing protein n=1 Tax=Candidatus Woesebacteria bacterium RIFCSPLOWO2_01_FULL_39_25 TaxID=1802521 RepID=A0A1F8BLB9_9BACT|nr:MAG: hypothetical protein A2124_03335 [Candidatus Woesebacteria bacterium GWB1_37_5]OGM25336.1 MAG: hypothetical protein A2715_04795 [Candidatus Woesebacteria bacterium RIFCSPHIGHO2_01_FULL_39_32]OGM37835.1 MAG: hypothetical protein A3F01_02005 [Candidatus Woesebacteria bacterium RIFCSPHIGHO2_12_FULL_38_11]OGM64867.1 MAG: hypothetical protein A2893_04405 [Candidatus Woesebacteria bacterium RIFCSPLOWO2_01_FULL_39_25]